MAQAAPTLDHDPAFEGLYQRYAGDVYRYALALLRNPADAEDATQTTFLNAYRAMQRGEEPQRPLNWLITIAHNACRKRFALAARRVREVPLDESIARLPVSDEERPRVEGVLEALGRLPFNQRAALVMRELEGRSYAEIAETLGITRPAVEALLFRARRSLRVRRAALRSLGAVQLPGSLARLLQEPSALAGGGSALAGSGVAAKIAVLVAVGAAVGGGAPTTTGSDPGRFDAVVTPIGGVGTSVPAGRAFSLPPLRREVRLQAPTRGGRDAASDASAQTDPAATGAHTSAVEQATAPPAGSGSASSPASVPQIADRGGGALGGVADPPQLPSPPPVSVPEVPPLPPLPVTPPPPPSLPPPPTLP